MKILLTTGSIFDGYRVTDYLGIVSREILFRVGLGSALDAAIQNISISHLLGDDAEAKGTSDLIQRAKDRLSQQFETELEKRGANAALGIDYETTILESRNIIRVAMTGTAVRVEKNTPKPVPEAKTENPSRPMTVKSTDSLPSIAFDDDQCERLLDAFSSCASAAEMLDYMDSQGLTAETGTVGSLYAAVKQRKEIERMYGKNLTVTMNELRAIVEGK